MRVWLSNDKLLGYAIWKREPFLVKTTTDHLLFVNDDGYNELMFSQVTDIERRADNFPDVPINTYKSIRIPIETFNYYFYQQLEGFLQAFFIYEENQI